VKECVEFLYTWLSSLPDVESLGVDPICLPDA